MTEIQNSKPVYDLEERTFQFAKDVRLFVKTLPKTIVNIEDGKQLVKASGSVGANYRAACRGKSKSDFVAKLGIVAEETDEVLFWLEVLVESGIIDYSKTECIEKEANEILSIIIASIKTAKGLKD